jgi:hypothetical protein
MPTVQATESQSDLDPEVEDGEAMEVINEDEDAMMSMMGLNGFRSTKVGSSPSVYCATPACSHLE